MTAPDVTVAPGSRPEIRGLAGRRAGLIEAAGGWRGVGLALAVFAASRIAQLALVAWMRPADGRTLGEILLIWDGDWFVRVATEGYPQGYTYDGNGALTGNGYAFFPLYPLLIRATAAISGLQPRTAAVVVAWLAAAAAAVLIYLLGTSLYDRRVGYALLALFCTQPMSVVLSLAYSESLFLALVAGMLLAAHRRAWPAAGVLGLAAALTRPTGAAAAGALAVAAAVLLLDRDRTATGRERWLAAIAATVALAGVPGYLLWVGLRVGDLDAWFRIQAAGWETRFDFGATTLRFLHDALRAGEGFVEVSVALLIVAVVVAAAVALARRVWPPLAAYGLGVLVLVLGQGGYYHCRPRLLLPVLLVLVPVALAVARTRSRAATAVTLSAFAAFGLWYGAYMVTVWPYAI